LYGRDECVRSANKTANQLFGYGEQVLIGKPLKQLIVADNNRMLGLRRDNSTFVAKINTQTLFEFNDQISMCTITDVSEQERKEKQLMYLAFHDQLTGLPNRGLLVERLRQDLLRAKRDSTFLAVLFLDLDGFKDVNDEMGHDAGDELLQAVAKRFEHCCREVDTVARLGGDEFVFVLTSLHSVLAVKQVAQNVLKAVNQAFLIHNETVKIGASIGIAMYPTDHSEAELLIKCADDAMYTAKQRGKNQLVFTTECR
jgi:diguanylate cyclase (GGDEF)-like protein